MRSRLVPPSLVLASLLAACSTPYKTPVFAARADGDTSFAGVASLLDKRRPLDILFVHGMCTHEADWATGAVRNVFQAVGGDPKLVDLKKVPVEGTGIVLYQQTLQAEEGPLRANAILWSPLTTPLKAQLCYDQTNKSATCPADEKAKAYPYQRASLNRLLKDTILDDCLSDAMIYQGKSRDEINRQMQRAILQAVATSGGERRGTDHAALAAAVPTSIPLLVVTESLGSKLAFDAIFKLSVSDRADTRDAGLTTFARTTTIFMGANQLPILALADRQLDGTVAAAGVSAGAHGAAGVDYPEDPIAALMRQSGARALDGFAAKPPRVVAFTDPNDLLSFILAPSPHAAAAGYPVVDVVVSNDKAYLGLVELPTTAHGGYRSNEAVRKLIACGNPLSDRCKK